jgi:hypothetical protein
VKTTRVVSEEDARISRAIFSRVGASSRRRKSASVPPSWAQAGMRAASPVELAGYRYMLAVVGDEGEPLRPRPVDLGKHRFHLAPVRGAGELEVVDLGGDASFAADAHELVDRVGDAAALAAQVRGVLALVAGRHLAELDDLLGPGVGARRVDECGADAEIQT